jgi:hypothetical protein
LGFIAGGWGIFGKRFIGNTVIIILSHIFESLRKDGNNISLLR